MSECVIWTGAVTGNGYGRFNGEYAHRIAFRKNKGPIPEGMYVCHTCDNRLCINHDHLWLGTAADNTQDMVRKGRARGGGLQGVNHGMARLTEDYVREIRSSRARQIDLAEQYGVTQSLISAIRLRKLWSHVQ